MLRVILLLLMITACTPNHTSYSPVLAHDEYMRESSIARGMDYDNLFEDMRNE